MRVRPILLSVLLLAIGGAAFVFWPSAQADAPLPIVVSPARPLSAPPMPTFTSSVNSSTAPASSADPVKAVPAPEAFTTREVGPDPAVTGPWADGNVEGIYRAGSPAVATVAVGGRSFELLANEVGAFPRVYVAPEARAEVSMHYPEARPGESIQVQMIDGGTLGGQPALHLTVGSDGRIAFPVTASAYAGKHQVFLNYGGDRKVLTLWVGAPLPIRTALVQR
jgi:hypothetical protein